MHLPLFVYVLAALLALAPAASAARPPSEWAEQLPAHAVFICNARGSMFGLFDAARAEVRRRLDSLGALQAFNIIIYQAGHAAALRDGLLDVTAQNRSRAAEFLSAITPRGAGGELDAFDKALALRPQAIVWLTNDVIDLDALQPELKSAAELKIRIDIGVYGSVNEQTGRSLKRIASDSGGVYRGLRIDDAGVPAARQARVPTAPPRSAATGPAPTPATLPTTRAPQRIALLVDATGSMMSVYDAVRMAIRADLRAMSDRDQINVAVLKASTITRLRDTGFVPVAEGKQAVIEMLDETAPRGDAEVVRAFRWAIEQEPTQILLWTDGDLDDLAGLTPMLKALKAAAPDVRVRISAATAPNDGDEQRLRQLARETGAEFKSLRDYPELKVR
jgi:hypothetical protein